jgi:hypothetical protein
VLSASPTAFKMDCSLEKAGALHTEHAAVMNDAFRSMSEEAADEVLSHS